MSEKEKDELIIELYKVISEQKKMIEMLQKLIKPKTQGCDCNA